MRSLLSLAAMATLVSSASAQTFFGPGLPATSFYGGLLFNIENVSSQDVVLTGRVNAVSSWTGDGQYRLFYKSGSYVGSENTLANWTEWGLATANGGGPASYMPLDFGSDISLAAGQSIGVAIFHVGGSGLATGDGALGYRNGASIFDNGALKFTTGTVKGYGSPNDPFATHSIGGRTWAGQFEYAAVPEPATLAALGLGIAAVIRRRRR